MHLLERVVEKPHACAYLAAERASLEVRVMLDVTAEETGRPARAGLAALRAHVLPPRVRRRAPSA